MAGSLARFGRIDRRIRETFAWPDAVRHACHRRLVIGYFPAGIVFACPGSGAYAGGTRPARSVLSSSDSTPIPLQIYEAGSGRALSTHRHTNEGDMPSYTYRRRASNSSRLTHPIESSADGVRSDSEARKTVVRASEVDAAKSGKPTLDDFGGRSDALGG
jgi:hypothetical protein